MNHRPWIFEAWQKRSEATAGLPSDRAQTTHRDMRRAASTRLWPILVVFLSGSETAASPAPLPRGPTYKLRWAFDLPLVLIPAFSSLGWVLSTETPKAHCAPLCERSSINAFDRPAAGNFSTGWTLASDLSLFAGIAGAATLVIADEGLEHGLNDFVVGLEAIFLTSAAPIPRRNGPPWLRRRGPGV